jgi:hypothetical protein
MAGATEYGQLEARLAGMSDAEIVDALERSSDYEPWALDLFRAEFARRELPAELHQELRAESAAQVAVEEKNRASADRRIFWAMFKVALFFLPLVLGVCARRR